MIPKKYIRIFLSETPFKIRVVIILLLSILSFTGIKFVHIKNNEYSQIRKDKLLVDKITQMEEEILSLRPKEPRKMAKMERDNRDYALEGVGIQGGVMYALINGIVCQVGDEIDEYIVNSITKGSTVLKNDKTSEIRNLYLYNE